jgi:hypothetical protein
MPKQPETRFKEKAQKDLKDLQRSGEPIWFTKIQQVAIRGTPDNFLVVAGWGVALELKRNSLEQPDPLQLLNLARIIDAGGFSFRACPRELALD